MDYTFDFFPLIPIFLYAEIHFKFFKWFPSLLYQKMPEIVFDLPRRLNKGEDLPVILILNDVNKFNVSLLEVSITVQQPHQPIRLFTFHNLSDYELPHYFSASCRTFLFWIERKNLQNGHSFINAKAVIERAGKCFEILNDNFIGTSKAPFCCFISDTDLPSNELVTYGDIHVHSIYSQSHVEFGPPLRVIDIMTKAYGLDFACIADHSYDLACSLDNYLVETPDLERWKLLKEETESSHFDKTMIMAEEISCINSKGNVVHVLGLDLKEFIEGSADGSRFNKIYTRSLSISQVASIVHSQNGLIIAAHPGEKGRLIQRIALRRGSWSNKDFSEHLDAIQGINCGFGKTWQRSKKLWIKQLLTGKKLPLVAGNDAHGDFNRYRCIGMPFFSVKELNSRFFASCKTGLYGKAATTKEILSLIRSGATFATSGPMLCLSKSEKVSDCIIGKTLSKTSLTDLFIICKSIKEFGRICELKIFCGDYYSNNETLAHIIKLDEKKYEFSQPLPLSIVPSQGYLRAELVGFNHESQECFAVTSPCYFTTDT